jgi:hypothetical protein
VCLQHKQIHPENCISIFEIGSDNVSIAILINKIRDIIKFSEENSKLLARCIIEDDIDGKGKITYDPNRSVTIIVFKKRFTKLIGKYPIYSSSEEEKMIKKIKKRYKSLPDALVQRLKSNDTNNDGKIGTAKIVRLLKKYSDFSKKR